MRFIIYSVSLLKVTQVVYRNMNYVHCTKVSSIIFLTRVTLSNFFCGCSIIFTSLYCSQLREIHTRFQFLYGKRLSKELEKKKGNIHLRAIFNINGILILTRYSIRFIIFWAYMPQTCIICSNILYRRKKKGGKPKKVHTAHKYKEADLKIPFSRYVTEDVDWVDILENNLLAKFT